MKLLKKRIKDYLLPTSYEASVIANNKQLFHIAAMQMKNQTLNSHIPGITNEQYTDAEVVVSLTTYSKRLYEVYLTIESIMQGTLKPNRIVLWLEDNLKNTVIPIYLQRQMTRGLEIQFYKDIRSYKKLIPSLKLYPKSIIVTIDDDAIYEPDLLEKLVNAYNMDKHHIYANRVSRIELNDNYKPKEYSTWSIDKETGASPLNFFTGVGGVLYPPNCFCDEVLNEDVFQTIAPYGDDIWFYTMSLLNGYTVYKVYTHDANGNDFFVNESVQDISLYHKNIEGEKLNDTQIKAVFDKYNIYKLLKPCNTHQ